MDREAALPITETELKLALSYLEGRGSTATDGEAEALAAALRERWTEVAPPPLDQFFLDAYGHLEYTVGWSDECDPEDAPDRGDWLACADYDVRGQWVGYHVVVNSDSGGFVDTLDSGVVSLAEAEGQIGGLLSRWLDVASEHLAADGQWFTDEEVADNTAACERWRDEITKLSTVEGETDGGPTGPQTDGDDE
jgi:hypothetical protein